MRIFPEGANPVRAVWCSYFLLVACVPVAVLPTRAVANEVATPSLQTAPHLRLHQVNEDDMAVYLAGDKMEVNDEGELVITGDAQVRRIDSVSKGDQIRYRKETGDVKVRGNGMLMRDGSIVRSPVIDYNLDSETGEMSEPQFWMNSGGSGTAEHGTALSRQHLRLKTVNYSACPCPAPSWFIKAPTVDLHFDDNEGIARHGVLYFKDVPILYSPYFSFPLREERKSGFLTPTYGYSSNSGFEFGLPYYFNLAPNYDATLTPRYYSKRGTQLEGEFRYLGRSYEGQLAGTYLGNDKQVDDKRWLFAAEHRESLGNGFGASYRYNRVSDDNYFRDFSTFDINNSTVTELASTGALTWSGAKYFNSALSVTRYQTLQDETTGYRRPEYNRMPELSVRGRDTTGMVLIWCQKTRLRVSKCRFIRVLFLSFMAAVAYQTIEERGWLRMAPVIHPTPR
ncbi:LPS-assembly protein LptD [Paenalcaligenes niemegkensis]|uniref:LPS-assembly protein LptD n=1 Tax=Paenalcaligenes niemegkensis TaxID=2895469 RepID=UPI0027E37F5B|nr:LPS assembly protein LptD [Paenalcaligenes niemegkensis]